MKRVVLLFSLLVQTIFLLALCPNNGTDANGDGICDDAFVINEINYRNLIDSLDIKFIELFNNSNNSINISGWHLTNGINYTFPAGTTVASGQFIVVAENPTHCQNYFGVSGIFGPYQGNLSSNSDEIELRDASFFLLDVVDYQRWKEWPNITFNDDLINDIKNPVSIQKINSKMDGKHGGSWLGHPPTPKAQNTGYVSNYTVLPIIKNVSKSPDASLVGQEVRIKAGFDKHSNYQSILSVNLQYQVVTPGNYISKSDAAYQSNWTTIPMLDDGMNADSTANNGVYTAAIPSSKQIHRNFIRYRVKVTTSNGYNRTFPDQNHYESNYAYYVYDTYPTTNGYNLNALDSLTELTILTKAATTEVYVGDQGQNTNQYQGKEYLGKGTLIYNGKVYDHIRFRPRGGDSRQFRVKPGLKFDFNDEKEVRVDDCEKDYDVERSKLALSGTWSNDIASHGLTETLIYKVLELSKAPFFKQTDYSHLRIVDGAAESGDFWGIWLVFEDYGGDHLKENNLPEGNIWTYKPTTFNYQGDFPGAGSIGPLNQNNFDYNLVINDRIANVIFGQNGNNYYGKHSQRDYYSSATGQWFTWWSDMDNGFGSPYDDVMVFPRSESNVNANCDNDLIIPSTHIIEYRNRMRSVIDLLLNTEQREYLVDQEAAKIYNPSASYDWTTVDHSKWNQTYDLGSVDAQINWYKTWFQYRKNYIENTTFNDGTTDAAIPAKPTISLTGSNALDNLTFSNSSFSDPQGAGTFAALEWRVGEWSDPANPVYQDKCPKYEVQTKWQSGEITSFSSSYTIPADAQLKIGRTYKIRVRYKDHTGRWSHWSNPVQVVPTPAINFTPANLVINEIMYHPEAGCGTDFIEIYNDENTTVALDNYKFTEGINFDFPAGSTIPSKGYLVLAKDSLEFSLKYGFSPFGDYSGSLSNDGENIRLKGPFRTLVDSLTYNDANPWDKDPDGFGPSLELLHPLSDNTDPLNWFRSDMDCGTPGAANSRVCTGAASPIIINEINYNSNNPVADPGDWIELYNPNANAINLSGWTFFDDNNEFVIPAGTTIAANEYLVLVENNALFSAVFPHLTGNQKLGNFVFSLSNKGERLSLFNQDKCLSDYVVYDDQSPWPLEPDGTGPTLSLKNYWMDNALASSWQSSSNINAPIGTPGRSNTPCPTFTIVAPTTYCKGESLLFHTQTDNSVDFTWTIQGGIPSTATGDSVYIVFQNPGLALVELQAEYYECSETDQVLASIVSCNSAPVPQPDNYTINEDNTLNDNVLTNDTEPEGQPMTVSLGSGVSNGTLTLNPNGSFTYLPNANYFGADGFTYEVCDNASPALCATETVTITINSVNDAPTTNSDAYSGLEDNQLNGNVLTNDSDIDGTLTATVETAPSNGTVSLQANGSFIYTPNQNYFGNDNFVYEVCDNGSPSICLTETVSLSISPVNDAPISVADAYLVNEDGTLNNNVLTNDSDIENHSLSASLVTNVSNGSLVLNANGSFTYTPTANYNGSDGFTYEVCDNGSPVECTTETVSITINQINDAPTTVSDLFIGTEDVQTTGNVLSNDSDIDGHSLTATVQTTTSNGTLTLQSNGSFSYLPDANFFGSDNFVYKACDNGSPSLCKTETVTLSISPVNDAPVSVADNYSLNEDNIYSNNVLTNDSDIENQSLSTAVNSNVANGTLSLNSNGNFTYTPNTNYNGTDAFTYEVCDNGSPALCVIETVDLTINPINDGPSTTPDSFTGTEDTPLTDNVLTNDSDVEGDSLTTTISATTSNGTISLLADGSFTYTPNANYFGNDNFVYEVCDSGSPSICETETVSLSIAPVNDAPISVVDNYTINEDDAINSNVLTNDSDIENQPLSASIVTNVANGVLTLNTNGSFVYTPNLHYFGSDGFVYQVCDTDTLCVTESVTIIINSVNDAPSTASDAFTGTEDIAITGNVLSNDSDIDGNTLTTTVNSNPTNGSVNLNSTGGFTYTPNPNYNGNDAFVYEVCDNGSPSICVTENVSLSLAPVNDPPVTKADVLFINEDASGNNNVLTNDTEVEGQPMQASLVTNVANGTLTLNANGSYFYTPNANYNGIDSFTYQACDDTAPALCTAETVTITINPINDAPIVLNDTLSTDQDIQVAGDVSTNDSDIETAQMSYSLISYTNHGSILFNFDGSFYYTPFAGYHGVDSFIYRACDNGSPNYCSIAIVYIDVIPDCIVLDFALHLEGAYDTQTGLMHTNLNTVRALLPGMAGNPVSGQPYDVAPWYYLGDEGLGWTDTDYDSTVVDWILLSLRTDVTKASEVVRIAGILNSDGTIEFPESCLNVAEFTDSYYIVAEHRNHMAVMSPNKVSVVNRTLAWDFRTANSYTSGGNGAIELSPGVWGLYAGDCNQADDVVRNDINGKDKTVWNSDNGKFGLYLLTDVDMNGDVTGSDKATWLLNNGVFGSVTK